MNYKAHLTAALIGMASALMYLLYEAYQETQTERAARIWCLDHGFPEMLRVKSLGTNHYFCTRRVEGTDEVLHVGREPDQAPKKEAASMI